MLDRDDLLIPGLLDEELAAPVAGLRFFHVPTPDQTAPPADGATLELVRTLGDAVRGGDHVAVHCHAGHGRSPAFAAALLVATGSGADEAMAALSRARARPVPHRAPQRDWVRWVEQQLLADSGPPAR